MKQPKTLACAIVSLVAIAISVLGPPRARAQAQDQDPPGRVARLEYSSGSVSFQPGGEGDWVQAANNRPVTTGDNLWADQNSRAEVQVGSTSIRMDSETSVTFLELNDHATQLKLSLGTLEVRVRHLDDGDGFEVDTPNLAFNLQTPGEYRLQVNASGDQTISTVWSGRGEATGGGSSFVVIAGQQATFTGTDQLDHQISQLPERDDFDTWVLGRDQREDQAESANYISTEMTGYQDLDDSGHWHYLAGYGPVWTPSGVVADWAPYRYGHWVWIDPWGWTWVEDEPWGFAPFHYGRWAFAENSWCWVPGPVVVRPYYAPALVAFVGGGGFNPSLAPGGAAVGWFPLAPREVYVPWYPTSREYLNSINVTNTRVNIVQITDAYNAYNSKDPVGERFHYANQQAANGVTVVSRDTFVNARPVNANLARIDRPTLVAAPVARELPVQPVRASVLGGGAPAVARPPASIANRQVVATRNPPPPRSSVEQRREVDIRALSGDDEPRGPEPEGGERAIGSHEVPRPPSPGAGEADPARSFSASNPLVKSAPPVQERAEQQKSEQEKFDSWQKQRDSAAKTEQHGPRK